MIIPIYSDETHNEWPVVLVTNPKDARFLAPSVEPVQKIRLSTEIRILAFSIRYRRSTSPSGFRSWHSASGTKDQPSPGIHYRYGTGTC